MKIKKLKPPPSDTFIVDTQPELRPHTCGPVRLKVKIEKGMRDQSQKPHLLYNLLCNRIKAFSLD